MRSLFWFLKATSQHVIFTIVWWIFMGSRTWRKTNANKLCWGLMRTVTIKCRTVNLYDLLKKEWGCIPTCRTVSIDLKENFKIEHKARIHGGEYSSEGAAREWSTVVDISIVSLYTSCNYRQNWNVVNFVTIILVVIIVIVFFFDLISLLMSFIES